MANCHTGVAYPLSVGIPGAAEAKQGFYCHLRPKGFLHRDVHGALPSVVQERFEEKWNNTVVPKLAEDEAACRADEANMRRRIAEVVAAFHHRDTHHGRRMLYGSQPSTFPYALPRCAQYSSLRKGWSSVQSTGARIFSTHGAGGLLFGTEAMRVSGRHCRIEVCKALSLLVRAQGLGGSLCRACSARRGRRWRRRRHG